MRTLAIGDVHGCHRALIALSNFVPFEEDDQIVMLGDYVDRGPHSKQVLEWVMQRVEQGNCIPLMGNHEIMLLAAVDGQMPIVQWEHCGGRETLRSYAHGGMPSVDHIDPEHVDFIRNNLLRYHETETHLFAHAGMLANIPPDQQADYDLFWDRFDLVGPHRSGKIVICGHTAQRSGIPANRGHAVCIDTWVYGQGWLTCLDVNSGRYWQADQYGNCRSDFLPPPTN